MELKFFQKILKYQKTELSQSYYATLDTNINFTHYMMRSTEISMTTKKKIQQYIEDRFNMTSLLFDCFATEEEENSDE